MMGFHIQKFQWIYHQITWGRINPSSEVALTPSGPEESEPLLFTLKTSRKCYFQIYMKITQHICIQFDSCTASHFQHKMYKGVCSVPCGEKHDLKISCFGRKVSKFPSHFYLQASLTLLKTFVYDFFPVALEI